MFEGKRFLAIIPARSGSKGLPDKNIKSLCGKPLLAWSIESALDSKYIDEVVVSTDSSVYAEIAKDYGANVPFLRPKNLASDTTSTFDVLEHCIRFYKQNLQKEFDYIVLLEPTSPLRVRNSPAREGDIDRAIRTLCAHEKASALVGIAATESSNPAFLVRLENGFIRSYENNHFAPLRRQDIAPVYFFEGSIYVSEIGALLAHRNFYHAHTLGFIMPKWQSLEVDDGDDFAMIEAMINTHKELL
ncbi:acylneuraminate cytidylyltransferase family protein [Helicobacter jaachi]|uniref:Acylneuraminate cytidylyltransferase family protein n=1 Tax=Helicobacter jaachi TaxID=1677920 RepID=A0A4U8T9I3_9HELI|nr:acylneuraminate cytidylyltransferase family protein [Helicobacter jaachi]TLD96480.1 acylneuraminate cytidylyltransferase family protein [Helicobacter jaachi]